MSRLGAAAVSARDRQRSALPFLGFVIGAGVSLLLWGWLGALVWLLGNLG